MSLDGFPFLIMYLSASHICVKAHGVMRCKIKDATSSASDAVHETDKHVKCTPCRFKLQILTRTNDSCFASLQGKAVADIIMSVNYG